MKIASGKLITGLSIVTESLISQSVHMSLITQATQVFCVKQLFRETLCNYIETTPKGIVGSFQACIKKMMNDKTLVLICPIM